MKTEMNVLFFTCAEVQQECWSLANNPPMETSSHPLVGRVEALAGSDP